MPAYGPVRAATLISYIDTPVDYGEAQYEFLHPTEHLIDEVNEEQADERRKRIHEQCGVIKFGKDKQWIIIVGDADRCAFEDHIVKNLKSRLKSFCLGASHHGSDTFFRQNEEEEEYIDGLEAIDPEYTVVSAPTQEESKHDHPCEFAMEKYEEQCGEDNVYHTGEERYSFYFDIYSDGTHSGMQDDGGRLAEEYGLEDENDDGGDDGESKADAGYFIPPREAAGEYQPKKYG